jgi:hypothetical protein
MDVDRDTISPMFILALKKESAWNSSGVNQLAPYDAGSIDTPNQAPLKPDSRNYFWIGLIYRTRFCEIDQGLSELQIQR